MSTRRKPRVVALGGGHGLAASLRAVRRYADPVTAIVSVADDGGSSGRLREALGVHPPGDVRKCLVALGVEDSVWGRAFEHRFEAGELDGHPLGNLVLAGLAAVTGSFVTAIEEAGRLVRAEGRVLPATTVPVVLKATSEDGEVEGQVAIGQAGRIGSLSLVPPDPEPPAEAVEAVLAADQVVVGPGSLFTSVLAVVAVPGLRQALAETSARKIYVCNLRPQLPETDGYDVAAHLDALSAHGLTVDAVVCDTARIGLGRVAIPCVEADLTREDGLAHDPVRLASVLADLVGCETPARGSSPEVPAEAEAMRVKVGINGFGRIGRNYLRAVVGSGADIEVVALNDLTSVDTNAHLLRYDSTQGRFDRPVEVTDDGIRVGSSDIRVFAERDPSKLPWGELGVDVVIESTGAFTDGSKAAAHIDAGAKLVLISAPGTNVDGTFVIGVNDDQFDPAKHRVVSNASCTTNCFVPMVKVLDDAFGVEHGLMTTVHAYTNDQNLLDLVHKDPRRARAAAVNIVPASTGAARATSLVMESMKGRLDGAALRVPVPDGSITDFTAVIGAEATADDVNAAFRKAADSGPLSSVLVYTEEPVVSSDIVGTPASCTFDSKLTMAMALGDGRTLVKVFGWYDNEWGYSNRMVDMTLLMGRAAGSSVA